MTYTKEEFKIVFMGTPDFAVASLKTLVENKYNIVGVITSPDKPAGRGKKISQSAVKVYAEEQGLNVLQPTNLKDSDFQNELQNLNANLQVVVAFRMLPEAVWSMPELGSINLHASLLPNYRGAAPINWAVINGEKETGATTFFLKHEIDTGDIIMQNTLPIKPNDNAGSVHDNLMHLGAELLLKTVSSIVNNNYTETPQKQIQIEDLKHAPKIFKDDCKINWNNSLDRIHNKIRGLSPYPAAWSNLTFNSKVISFKLFKTEFEICKHNYKNAEIISDSKTFFKIATTEGILNILELQLAGKKRMNIKDFLQGFQQINQCAIQLEE